MNTAITEVTATNVVVFIPFQDQLIEFKEQFQNNVYDLTDNKQNKQARSDAYKIGTVVANLDRAHKDAKAPLKAQSDLLDAERKRIKDELQAVQARIKKQIEDHDAALQAIEDALEARVQSIRSMAGFADKPTSDFIFERMLEHGAITIDDSYAPRIEDAIAAHQEVAAILSDMYDEVCQQEANAAELNRLREQEKVREQEERNRLIAEQAVEVERKRQERAIQLAEEAAALAEQKQLQAEQRAVAAEAEAARKQAEKEQREQLERDQREQDEAHRQEIRIAVCAALLTVINDDELTAAVFDALDCDLIPHVKIEY